MSKLKEEIDKLKNDKAAEIEKLQKETEFLRRVVEQGSSKEMGWGPGSLLLLTTLGAVLICCCVCFISNARPNQFYISNSDNRSVYSFHHRGPFLLQ